MLKNPTTQKDAAIGTMLLRYWLSVIDPLIVMYRQKELDTSFVDKKNKAGTEKTRFSSIRAADRCPKIRLPRYSFFFKILF